MKPEKTQVRLYCRQNKPPFNFIHNCGRKVYSAGITAGISRQPVDLPCLLELRV